MNLTKKLLSVFTIYVMATTNVFAANTVTTIEQVTSRVDVVDNVDYTITSSTPFAGEGVVNIENTDYAVVIIKGIKPSKVISSWLKYVTINGQRAVNNSNCQVKMYGYGTIILPYSSSIKPLTVYSEQKFAGESCNAFGLENTGGYMNTLTEAKLNNRIRSFKLKRGYMVTFSTRKEGRGYSRCFIADKEDLEISSLPTILDKRISSYRVFHWYNAKKAGLASDTRAEANDALNSSWCYDWGTGVNRLPDVECVPNHIYEDWPSSAACGSVTYSCHMKTNNEPGNSADDKPQDVATVLGNWENLMRTGLRLCSESSHDGSMSHLKAFIDSIDARGWRCDILDLHCYWPSGTFNNLNWYSSNYGNGRPIWISEWVWGASWNRNGFWGAVSDAGSVSESNQKVLYDGTKPILDVLNSNSKVERYAYWNSEAAGTHIYHDGNLTKLGEYYANMGEGLGYNPANEFIPKNPPMKQPSDLAIDFDKENKKVTLKWHEYNGEYNQAMDIMVKKVGALSFSVLQSVPLEEGESDYCVTVDGSSGYSYRVRIKDLNGNTINTNDVTAVNESVAYGDEVAVSAEEVMYLGGNKLVNGDFELGLADWTNGAGDALSAPYFQAVPKGGVNGGAYLQCYGNGTSNTDAQAVRKIIDITPNTYYYVSAAGCNDNPNKQTISISQSNTTEGMTKRIKFPDVSEWLPMGVTFQAAAQKYLWISLYELAYKAQFDDFKVCELFSTREEAMADALVWAKKRAEAFLAFNTWYGDLNEDVRNAINNVDDANALENIVANAIRIIKERKANDPVEALKTDAERAIPEGIPYVYNTTAVENPSFAATSGWTTKCGTYTAGDQRTATQEGKTCWNAWWAIPASGNEDKTMAIRQQLTKNNASAASSTTNKLEPGLYALECKASTQHLCENDQHGFLIKGQETLLTPNLSVGVLDLPNFSADEKWETLSTSYVYANFGDTLTIGFEGSKRGTVDKSWKRFGESGLGDNREGWWCATDFKLRYVPLLKRNADAKGWGTICLPRAISIPEGVELYKIAGILKDSTAVCLERVTETEAGVPYVFFAQPRAEINFYQQGDAVTKAQTNVGGLRGAFITTTNIRTGSLDLVDGKWTVVTTPYPQQNYSAFIYQLKNLTYLDSFSGVKLPTSGLVSLRGDVTSDGVVDVADINAVISVICGTSTNAAADVTKDGVVDVADINAVISVICGK